LLKFTFELAFFYRPMCQSAETASLACSPTCSISLAIDLALRVETVAAAESRSLEHLSFIKEA